MNDKYGKPLQIGSRVAKCVNTTWIYGTITSFDIPADHIRLYPNEDLMVRFDGFDYNDDIGNSEASEELILCEADVDAEYEVQLTITLAGRSANEAYDKVVRWKQDADFPTDMLELEIVPK